MSSHSQDVAVKRNMWILFSSLFGLFVVLVALARHLVA